MILFLGSFKINSLSVGRLRLLQVRQVLGVHVARTLHVQVHTLNLCLLSRDLFNTDRQTVCNPHVESIAVLAVLCCYCCVVTVPMHTGAPTLSFSHLLIFVHPFISESCRRKNPVYRSGFIYH